jgi:hypothetical protein
MVPIPVNKGFACAEQAPGEKLLPVENIPPHDLVEPRGGTKFS